MPHTITFIVEACIHHKGLINIIKGIVCLIDQLLYKIGHIAITYYMYNTRKRNTYDLHTH